MNDAIVMFDVRKVFGKKVALDRLNFSVPRGSCFALLGPNGAGKTTAIRLILNLLSPDHGAIKTLGKNSTGITAQDFQHIGYVGESTTLPEWLSIEEFFRFCATIHKSWDQTLCMKLAALFGLNCDTLLGKASRGMKMQASIISAIAFRPELLILDEPFAGLDALVREQMLEALLEILDGQEHTVLIASHDIDQLERIVNWTAFIDAGHCRFSAATEDILRRTKRVHIQGLDAETLVLPSKDEWINVTTTSGALAFTHCAYKGLASETEIRSTLRRAQEITVQDLSLREIFIEHAKSTSQLDLRGA